MIFFYTSNTYFRTKDKIKGIEHGNTKTNKFLQNIEKRIIEKDKIIGLKNCCLI